MTSSLPAPTRGDEGSRARGIDAPLIVALVGSALAAIVTLVATAKGPGLNADSVNYFSAGLNLSNGNGLRTFNGTALTMFPPGVSALVAGGDRLGLSPDSTLRIVNAVSFAVSVWFGYVLLRRHLRRPSLVMAATAFVALNVTLLARAEMALSECAFIPVSLGFILLVERAALPDDAGSRRVLWGSILGAAMAVWAGFALRYAAIAMIPAGGLALLVPFRRTGAKAVIGRAAAFGVLASIGPALVMLRNHGINGSLMGPRSESPDGLVTTVQRFVATLGRWVVPDPAPVGLQGVAGAALVAGFGALIAWAVWDPTRRASVFPPAVEGEVAPDSLSPLTCFVGVYAAYLVAAQITTAFDPIGTRLMSPMFVPLVVLCTALLERSWGLIGSARRPRLAFAAIGALVVLFVGHAVVFVVEARDANVEGVEYASRSWRDSEFVAAVGRVPADADLYSNVPAGVWAVHRREPLWKSPEKSLRRARQAVEMDPAFLRTVTCRPVYLAWSDEAVGDYLFTPEELRDHVELEEVEAVDDGAIYRVRPLTDGTAQSAGC